jgi:putative flippase GtrA
MRKIKYFVNGLIASTVHFLIFYLLYKILKIESAFISYLLASIIGIYISYFGNNKFVFNGVRNFKVAKFLKYIILQLILLLISTSLIWILIDINEINYIISFLFALIIQFFIGYYISKNYIFYEKTNEIPFIQGDSYKYVGDELELFSNAKNWKKYWINNIKRDIGTSVLEVGAGIGSNIKLFNFQKYNKWISLEPDGNNYNNIEKNIIEHLDANEYKVIIGTSVNIDEKYQFDTILYIDVLEHIKEDKNELINIQKYLKENGKIIIISPAFNFLYSNFDKNIGHYRRYDKKSLIKIVPEDMKITKLYYLDSIGLLASLGNKLILNSSQPTMSQIKFWDNFLVKGSIIIDKLLRYNIGKTIICIIQKK